MSLNLRIGCQKNSTTVVAHKLCVSPDLEVEPGGFSNLVTYYQGGASTFGTFSSSNEGEVSVLVASSIFQSIISI